MVAFQRRAPVPLHETGIGAPSGAFSRFTAPLSTQN